MPRPFQLTNDIFDAGRWVDTQGYLLDPATGNRLDAHTPHAWLLADRRMRTGEKFLGRMAGKLHVTALYGPHANGLQMPDNIEATVQTHDALGVEIYGWNRRRLRTNMQKSSRLDPEARTEWAKESRNARLLMAAQEGGLPVFSFDVENNGPPLDLFIMRHLDTRDMQVRQNHRLTRDAQRVCYGIEELRERAWPLKLGYELHRIRRRLPEEPRIMMSMGTWHVNVTRRLKAYGVEVEEIIDKTSIHFTHIKARTFIGVLAARRVTKRDLKIDAV